MLDDEDIERKTSFNTFACKNGNEMFAKVLLYFAGR
jgi:hypothetical protein